MEPAPLMQALHNWPFAVWLRGSAFAYPALEVMHIMGFALLFGTLWLVDMRLLGVRLFGLAQFAPDALAKAALPWTLLGFAVALSAGSLMFLSRASEFISNPAFVIKMGLLFAAGTNAAILHSRGALKPESIGTRVQAVLSILIWLAVMGCGRWIAYL